MSRRVDPLREAFVLGASTAADLADQYNGVTHHRHRLGDCILFKMNIRKKMPRRNARPYPPSIGEAGYQTSQQPKASDLLHLLIKQCDERVAAMNAQIAKIANPEIAAAKRQLARQLPSYKDYVLEAIKTERTLARTLRRWLHGPRTAAPDQAPFTPKPKLPRVRGSIAKRSRRRT